MAEGEGGRQVREDSGAIVGSGGPRVMRRKRERDAFKDISNDEQISLTEHGEAAASNRRARAPRRTLPPPMAPARRTTLRRSRRLADQPAHEEEQVSTGTDNAERGMSCDEDLEGAVVDLSFEGDHDDIHWPVGYSVEGSSSRQVRDSSRRGE
ncbi:unnamed protein product, partial [Discosporangium mesarthrocarpum]